MKLYHGSNTDIEIINLEMCRPYKDFGKGFYLTDLKEQAVKMANRVARIYGGQPILNVYEIEDDFRNKEDLKIKDFGIKTIEEWAEFIMNNRNRKFVERFPELSLFFKAFNLLYSEMICIFPYFCPYEIIVREIREILF